MRKGLRFNVTLTPTCQIDDEFEWRHTLEKEDLYRNRHFRPVHDARLG
jgi:hypothetical protein